MFRLLLALALTIPLVACDSKNSPPPGSGSGPGPGAGSAKRTPLIHKDHAYFGRYEGLSFQNACTGDVGCYRGGCGSEVCSAEQGVNSTCEVLSVQIPASAGCGCLDGQCLWFSTDGSTLPAAPDAPVNPPPPDGPACGNKTCATGEKCIEYFGVAGPAGPRFQECGIPCHPQKGGCPEGMTCTTIADGPGPVCRRKA